MIAIDSYGWIEGFANGPKAQKYNRVIDVVRSEEIVTSVVVLYEVYKMIKKLKGEQIALENVATLNQTNVIPIDTTLSLEAADYSLEHELLFSDALIYATARRFEVELWTGDKHLKGLPFVRFI